MMKVRPAMALLVFASLILTALTGCIGATPEDYTGETARLNRVVVQDPNGITVTLRDSVVKKVRLQLYAEDVVRVTATPQQNFDNLPDYLMVVAQPAQVPFEVIQAKDHALLKTRSLVVRIDLATGKVAFFGSINKPILTEAVRGRFAAVIDEPGAAASDSYSIQQTFAVDEKESFHGLGQRQDGLVNLAGHDVELTTHNLEISIPFLVSSKNYGILWNNAAVSRFGDPRPAAPLADAFTLYDAEGKSGGLTVKYYDGEALLLSRVEADTNYQFLRGADTREFPFPEQAAKARNLRVVLEGTLQARQSGKHTLKMYSSGYAKLSVDGEVKLDRWRMNWNPWYHNLDLTLARDDKKAIRLEWTPGGGYLRLMQNAPQSAEEEQRMSLSSDTGKAIDYFFVSGKNQDQLIRSYRTLTGKSVLLPKWAYGFWQSRERYKTQQEIIDTLSAYRARKIPIDNIVLDWSYWPEDAWGSHEFDRTFFPDPKALVDAVHGMNANIMISVWPKFYPTTSHYREFNAKGYLFNKNIDEKNLDWIGPGYLNAFYDAFSPGAREIYWSQIERKLNVYGFDAWWLDAVEPDIHSNLSFRHRKDLMTPNAMGTGAEYFNAYALPHAESVYKHDRESEPNKRVFILTRSGYGGIQRAASAIWSGDIVSRWADLKDQIAAGISVGLSGMPNWTFDIGGFTPEDRFRHGKKGVVGPVSDMDPEQVGEWQELNTRWFQFGAFAPLFRAHGQNPYREIFNIAEPGSDPYESMVWYTKLRYRLMPYIYSQAGDMYHKDGTLMRGLVMDFSDDPKVNNINDQYMFGPAFLINPVYQYQARTRAVYLPKGTDWYDFYSGERFHGGQTVTAAAPYHRMPIYVKAGSIVPTGPDLQYVDEKPSAPVTLNIYTGASGNYELYEDDGKTYAYEEGAYSRIPFHYDEKSRTLSIGDRTGGFPAMVKKRIFHVRWLSGPRDDAADFTSAPDATVQYSGREVKIQRLRP
jgi:alpha-D-xyloside xylohydrolase